MTKELEKYVITKPSRFKPTEVDISIEKVYVGESIEDKLTDYVLEKTEHSDNNIIMEWWVRKAYAIVNKE